MGASQTKDHCLQGALRAASSSASGPGQGGKGGGAAVCPTRALFGEDPGGLGRRRSRLEAQSLTGRNQAPPHGLRAPQAAAFLCLQVALLVAAEFWEQGDLERTVLDQQPIVSAASGTFHS